MTQFTKTPSGGWHFGVLDPTNNDRKEFEAAHDRYDTGYWNLWALTVGSDGYLRREQRVCSGIKTRLDCFLIARHLMESKNQLMLRQRSYVRYEQHLRPSGGFQVTMHIEPEQWNPLDISTWSFDTDPVGGGLDSPIDEQTLAEILHLLDGHSGYGDWSPVPCEKHRVLAAEVVRRYPAQRTR